MPNAKPVLYVVVGRAAGVVEPITFDSNDVVTFPDGTKVDYGLIRCEGGDCVLSGDEKQATVMYRTLNGDPYWTVYCGRCLIIERENAVDEKWYRVDL